MLRSSHRPTHLRLLAALRFCAGTGLFASIAASSLVWVHPVHAQSASIVFESTPKETGLKLDTTNLAPSSVEQDGRLIPTWVSRHKSVPADEWARSFGLTFSDPAFKNGKAPVVDVEIKFWHEANTAVKVVADTADGSQEVASGWGNKKELQTLRFRITNAYFGARKFGNDPKTLPCDGYDLRINAWATIFTSPASK